MRRRLLATTLLIPLATACASAGSGGGSAAMLSHAAGVTEATYAIADTTIISVDAGGQMIEIPATSEHTVTMAFAAGATGVEVTANWSNYSAVMANPMGAPERGSTGDVDGTLIFNVAADGAIDVVELPRIRGATENLLDPTAFAHNFFPMLPAAAPTAGMTWTDTIMYVSEAAGSFSESESILTYTLVGEEDWNGRGVWRITYEGSIALDQEGSQMGMAFTQLATGTTEGYVLWDLSAHQMVEHVTEAVMDGTMDLDQMPMPLELSIEAASTIRLSEGM